MTLATLFAAATISLIGQKLDMSKCELLYSFDKFDPADWTRVTGTPKWEVTADSITGGGPDEPRHGQIFYKTPVAGDIVLEFDAQIVAPSYHDLVWLYAARFDFDEKGPPKHAPWSAGYLGCLQGWYGDYAGIEKMPKYDVTAIHAAPHLEPGRTVHVVSGMIGKLHFIAVDGQTVTMMTDPASPDPTLPGYFGFGVYKSHCTYSHLKVWRPHPERQPCRYEPGTKRKQ